MLSVSATTRHPRAGEVDGREYLFVAGPEFDALIEGGKLLEWADVFGHRYGTPADPIEAALSQGRDVMLEIDVQGAKQVRDRGLPATFIFLVPPSEADLAERLRNRRTETEEDVQRRLAGADEEMQEAAWFDHVVVNDDVDRAAAELAAIIAGTPKEATGAFRPPIPPADDVPDA